MGNFAHRLWFVAVVAIMIAAVGGKAFGLATSGLGRAVGFHW